MCVCVSVCERERERERERREKEVSSEKKSARRVKRKMLKFYSLSDETEIQKN